MEIVGLEAQNNMHKRYLHSKYKGTLTNMGLQIWHLLGLSIIGTTNEIMDAGILCLRLLLFWIYYIDTQKGFNMADFIVM